MHYYKNYKILNLIVNHSLLINLSVPHNMFFVKFRSSITPQVLPPFPLLYKNYMFYYNNSKILNFIFNHLSLINLRNHYNIFSWSFFQLPQTVLWSFSIIPYFHYYTKIICLILIIIKFIILSLTTYHWLISVSIMLFFRAASFNDSQDHSTH